MADGIQHTLVPAHAKLGPKEKKDLLELYRVDVHSLPRILRSDPAIEHLNPQEGDIIKVERHSPTAGKAVFYRGVVND